MRLTLRTLLAYMDDILELEDAQDIARKIQESDRASQLLHRIRDVTQRPQLAAPELQEQGEGLDPNTVAEYLDNTLPADRVLDFEKVCLESDTHLAEVASCHQILTLILGEPAEVEPESRQRMYQVPQAERAAGPPKAEAPAAAPVAETPLVDAPVVLPAREKPRGPDDLRQPAGGRGWWSVALLLALAAGVVAAAYLNHQFDPGTPLGDLVGGWRTPPAAPAPVTPSAPTAEASASAPPATPATPVAEVRQPQGTEVASSPPSPETAQAPAAPLPPPGMAASEKEEEAVPPPPVTTATALAAPPATPSVPPTPATGTAGGQTPELPVAAIPEVTASPPAPAATPAVPAPAPAAAMPPEPIGHYNSASEILVRLRREEGIWSRVPAQAPLDAGELLVSLPTYRPALTLGKGLELQLFDGCRITLLPAGAEGVPGLAVSYGRLLLRPGRQPNASVHLQLGDRTNLVRLDEPGTELRLEVHRPDPPTADPETQPAPLVSEIYVFSGKVLWQTTPDQIAVTMTAPAAFRLTDGPPEKVNLEKLPAWDGPEAVTTLDQQAAGVLLRFCGPERPTLQTLQEQAEGAHQSRREVRWLAMRCLGHLGDFDRIAKALDDPEQKLYWPEYIEQLQDGIARGPESAAAVRRALEKVGGPELYELLWKYRLPPLKLPEKQQLAQFLDSPSLAVRVLTGWNLAKLNNMPVNAYNYRPDDTAAKRSRGAQKWRDKLGVGAAGRGKSAGTEGVPGPTPPAGSPF